MLSQGKLTLSVAMFNSYVLPESTTSCMSTLSRPSPGPEMVDAAKSVTSVTSPRSCPIKTIDLLMIFQLL